jgi:RNA polymerase sigma-70 factor (ECF subfamily)
MYNVNMDIESLIGQYLGSVYNYVYRLVNDKSEAEDITAEVFVKVWKNLAKINPDKNFKTWLFTIARNATIDSLSKKRSISFSQIDSRNNPNEDGNKKSFEETLVDIEPLPDEILQRKELVSELENALLKIRPDFREIILLYYTEELTLEEISKIVGKPLNTIKSQHIRTLSALRKLLV